MKISVIMPVNLEPYEMYEKHSGKTLVKSASNPDIKFVRAVNSFLLQTHEDKELIVVHDGCLQSKKILDMQFKKHLDSGLIKSISISKQPFYSGKMRQVAIEKATGVIICFLDADDYFGRNHLEIIHNNFDLLNYDWVYYNDYIMRNIATQEGFMRDVVLEQCRIGTSNIAIKNGINFKWDENGYGHDWKVIEKYLLPLEHKTKIITPEYYVCHVSGIGVDC